jgi:TonB family protein
LRSGVPDTVPGRSVDVCEGGIGAVLAGEVFAGELVGVEFQIPKFGPVLAKARVCYQERLRCGLQFLAIPPEQKVMIESWTHDRVEPPRNPPRVQAAVSVPVERPAAAAGAVPTLAAHPAKVQPRQEPSAATSRYIRRKVLMLLIASVIVVAGMGWWHWEEGWRELESKLPGHTTVSQPRTKVPGDVMMRLLVHRVDPVAPSAKMRGRVVLNAVVGADGSVQTLQAESGPELLARAAMDAVQWWRFQPYELNGQPIQVATTLEVNF